MQGQWTGKYSGTNAGDAILELDAVGNNFEGRVYVYDDRPDLPATAAFIKIPVDVTTHSIPDLPLTPLDPITVEFTEWQNIKGRFPGVTFPTKANTDWTIGKDIISVRWVTDIGTNGEATFYRVDGEKPSDLIPLDIHTWDEFRGYV